MWWRGVGMVSAIKFIQKSKSSELGWNFNSKYANLFGQVSDIGPSWSSCSYFISLYYWSCSKPGVGIYSIIFDPPHLPLPPRNLKKMNGTSFYENALVFSSPELKAQGELLWSLTVRRRHRRPYVRPSVHNLYTTSPPKPLIGFWRNFTGMILGWSSFKVVQMVPVCCISRSQELKIDFLTKNLKNLLVRNH